MGTALSGAHRAGTHCAIDAAVGTMIDDFNLIPTRAGLEDLGITAQMLRLGAESPSLRPTRDRLVAAVLTWARQGVIEDLLCTEVAQTYPAALLCGLAHYAAPGEFAALQDMAVAAMVRAGEWPPMTARIIRASLNLAGAEHDIADILRACDKRVLRTHTSAQDLEVLLQIAHCHVLDTRAPRASLLANILVVQALRVRDSNWLAVLLFLFDHVFVPAPGIATAVRQMLPATMDAGQPLLPAPTAQMAPASDGWGSPNVLRLRASIALQCHLDAREQGLAA